VYRVAVELLGLKKEQVLHVASHGWDIRGAKSFGMLGAYINRVNVPYGDSPLKPDLEVSRLTDLAASLSWRCARPRGAHPAAASDSGQPSPP